MRTDSVLIPRRTRKQSWGPGMAPTAFWWNFRSVYSASSLVIRPPPMTSLWPARYLVVDWRTMSAPSASGCCRYGVAKVLSTTVRTPCARARAVLAARSTTWRRGLDGLSSQSRRVLGRSAASTSAMLVMSTNENSIPSLA